MMVRYLDAFVMENLKGESVWDSVVCCLWRKLPPEVRQVKAYRPDEIHPQVQPLDEERIVAYAWVPDVFGNPTLLVRLEASRDIHRRSVTVLHYLVCTPGLWRLYYLVGHGPLHNSILSRILGLTREIPHIRASGTVTGRVSFLATMKLET
ncbi:MAG: hypothetical protein MZV64_09175 [Ignavibacteriales bacterium]|nr:hypothetical protein [Ignavibacteriales bacterium]